MRDTTDRDKQKCMADETTTCLEVPALGPAFLTAGKTVEGLASGRGCTRCSSLSTTLPQGTQSAAVAIPTA